MRSVFDTGSSTGSDTSARTGTPRSPASCVRVYKNASTTGLRQLPRRELYVCAGSSCSEYAEAACRLPACKSALMVFRWCEMSWRMARISFSTSSCTRCSVRTMVRKSSESDTRNSAVTTSSTDVYSYRGG